MSFVSAAFAALYLVALAIRIAARSTPFYVPALLCLSWLFYAWHVPGYLVLIVFSTAIDYVAARSIDTYPRSEQRPRRALLGVSVLVNLGLLGYFKYAGFLFGGGDTPSTVALPIGISFYTFQSMSYTIDVYRGRIPAERSFVRLACYVAFFPQLVAGPIVRAGDFLYQLDRSRPLRMVTMTTGTYLVIRGLFLKVVLADHLGVIVDQQWAGAAQPGASGVLAFSTLSFFACQLFCDFAGYTDIARGVGYHLGFRLPTNFNAPYAAPTFTEFWRRWHITLSSWFRDYLYIPLGGNRRGVARAYANLFLVMLIAGLWHGANWTFVVWGLVHGLALIVERAIGLARGAPRRSVALLWYAVVQLTWILSMGLFRADDLSQAEAIVGNAVSVFWDVSGQLASPDQLALGWWLVLPIVWLHVRAAGAERSLLPKPRMVERSLYAGAMLAAVLMMYTSGRQFIYFQF